MSFSGDELRNKLATFAGALKEAWDEFWKDEAEIASLWSRDRVFEPALARDAAAARLAQWRRAVERARGWDQAS